MKPQPEMGQLSLKDLNNSLTPQYYLHFTLAKILNGSCKTVEFEEGRKLTDFPDPVLLETGNYVLVTGKRLTDGSVLSSLTFFDIKSFRTIDYLQNPALLQIRSVSLNMHSP
jgi:hypothetical protein